MPWHRAPRRGAVLWFAVLLACLLPGSLRAQTTGEDATFREYSVYPDPSYGETDAVGRELTIYPDPNYGQASADAVSREYTVSPDTNATPYPDAVSREYAFWYFEDATGVKGTEDTPSVLTLRPPQPNPLTGTTDYANVSRPLGAGIGRPSELAVSIHSSITTSTFCRAARCVGPSPIQPGNSGTSAMNDWSSSLQKMMTS